MEKNLFELKMAAKEMARTSKRAEKNEASERKKIKRYFELLPRCLCCSPLTAFPQSLFSCMTKGNMDGARIHAENAIREKSQALNYLKMAARLEGVSSRVQTAVTMNRVSGSMAGVVKGMGKAMKAMDLEKVVLGFSPYPALVLRVFPVLYQKSISCTLRDSTHDSVSCASATGCVLQCRCRR